MENRVSIPPVYDELFVNTEYISVWIDIPDNYTWVDKVVGGRQVSTGGHDKYSFIAQFPCSKISKKITPYIIFKGEAPTLNPSRNTIALKLHKSYHVMQYNITHHNIRFFPWYPELITQKAI